ADGGVHRVVVEARGIELRDFAPGCELGRSNVLPIFPAVASDPDQAIVRSGPESVDGPKRGRERIDDAARLVRLGIFLGKFSQAGRDAGVRAREVGTDDLPILPAVDGLEEEVGGVVERVRIDGREHGWLCAVGAEFFSLDGNRRDVLNLAGVPVIFRNLASAAAVNDVGIERVGSDVAVFNCADGMPVALGDGAVVAAAGDADRAALLLAAADAVRKSVSDAGVIELRGRLVVPGAPRGTAVDAYKGTLVGDEQNSVRVDGVDPDVLVIIAARSATNAGPRFGAIG